MCKWFVVLKNKDKAYHTGYVRFDSQIELFDSKEDAEKMLADNDIRSIYEAEVFQLGEAK